MASELMRGLFPILATPFDDQDRIDEESLRREIDFNIDAGAHGMGVAFATEITKLTEAERLRLTEVIVDQTAGRVPVVVNTSGGSTVATVLYSRQTEDLGVDAVMCVPPPGNVPASEKIAYFKALSDAVSVPIFVQEAGATAAGGPLIRQIAEECEQVRYAKVESAPPPQKVYEVIQHGAELMTVFGGASGNYLIEELRRGSQGTMPHASLPHSFVRVWDQWQAGEEEAALRTWEREIIPVVRIGEHVHKQILYRQGIFTTPRFRSPASPYEPDEITQREFDEVCERLGIGQGKG